MRWFWFDRFTEFVSGQRASSIKNVALVEEQIDEYCPGFPHHPHSLIIEGMAQTAGLMVSELEHFDARVVLAKISRATFHCLAFPGDQITFSATLINRQGAGAIVEGTSHIGSVLQGEFELWFAFLDERYGTGPLFEPEELLRWLRVLRLYDVGVDQAGNRLKPPPMLLDAERQKTASTLASRNTHS